MLSREQAVSSAIFLLGSQSLASEEHYLEKIPTPTAGDPPDVGCSPTLGRVSCTEDVRQAAFPPGCVLLDLMQLFLSF